MELILKPFHKNCDDKGPTIWIAKIKDYTKLIEGYNPLIGMGIVGKLSCIINGGNCAVYCSNNYGPQMGDFYCKSVNNWKIMALHIASTSLDIPKLITIEDYEIFQVIKKV
ncbi:unnamed protein product [Rhizophagus irregularis]|nr:unnamed protein product [Rhizophagus irregularis]